MRSLKIGISVFVMLVWSQVAFAQLNLSKATSTNTPDVGTPFTYTINYANPDIVNNLANAVITDVLPPELSFVSGSIIGNTPSHIASATYSSTTRTITITFVNPLPAGSTGTISFSAAFPSNTYTGSTADNTATSTSGAGTGTSNTVTVTATNGATPPTFSDGVYIDKYAPYPEAGIGGGVNYGIRFGNLSESDATNFKVYDTLPSAFNLTYIKTAYFPNTDHPYEIYYQTNALPGVWQLLPKPGGGSFNTNKESYVTLSSVGVPPAGEWVTMVMFDMGTLSGNGDFYPSKPGSIGATLLGEAINPDHDGNPVDINDIITNCARDYATINGTDYSSLGCRQVTITGDPIVRSSFGKSIVNPQVGYVPGATIQYDIYAGSSAINTVDWENPVLVDLLPPELSFVGNVVITYPNTSVGTSMGTPVFTQIDNYNNTGQTLLRWEWPGFFPKNTTALTLHLVFDTQVRESATTGTYYNTLMQGGLHDYTACSNSGNADMITDTNDYDNDGNNTEFLCREVEPFNIVLPSAAGLESVKWVKGSLDANYSKYPAHANTTPGGLADYRLIVKNPGTIPIGNIIVIDILPFVGDTSVVSQQARLSEWRPFLAEAITPPAGVTVYYSTEQRPCRDELAGNNPTPFPTGCIDAGWTTTPPADITLVQALKFDFGSIVLQPDDSLVLEWAMRAPVDAPDNGEVAWNSFGYRGIITENDVLLLPSEPIKVGIAIEPIQPAVYGDYVWFDSNHDGIQNEPTSQGLNGVRVELYEDTNGNGIAEPGAGDDMVSFTLTSSNLGEPGYYLFPNLDPGNYFAVFYVPSGYNVSNSNQGTDIALDSDGVAGTLGGQSVMITPVTNLLSDEDDRTWDLGVYCTTPTATVVAADPTCTGGTANNDGNIQITATDGTKWGYSTGNAYTGPDFASATTVGALPLVVLNNIPNANPTTQYTIRLYSGDGSCYYDQTVVINNVVCTPLPCTLTVDSAVPTTCDPADNTYDVAVTVSYSNQPSGDITINVGGTDYTFTPDGTSPDTYTVTGLTANGTTGIDVSATFVGDNACTNTLVDAYDAPASCTTGCVASEIYLIDEDASDPLARHLWSFGNYNDPTNTGTDYGVLRYMHPTLGLRDITTSDGNDIEAMAVTPGGIAFILTSHKAEGGASGSQALFMYDLNTADANNGNIVLELIGHIHRGPTDISYEALLYDRITGRLYLADPVGANQNTDTQVDILNYIDLAMLNPNPLGTTYPVVVGPIQGIGEVNNYVDGMEILPDGRMFTVDGTDDKLYEIDRNTGAIIAIIDDNLTGGTESTQTDIETIAWDEVNNKLIGSDNFGQQFIEITFDNGNNVVLGDYGTVAGMNPDVDFESSAMWANCIETCVLDMNIMPMPTCDIADNLHDVSITLSFLNPPATGDLVVSIDGGAPIVVGSAPFIATIETFVTGRISDGLTHTVVASFTADNACTITRTYLSPAACSAASCTLTVDSAVPTACDPADNTYDVAVTVTYSTPPAGDITINVGGTDYTFTPDGTSPDTYNVTGLTSDGITGIDVSATFVGDNACTNTLLDAYDAPASCSTECPTQCVPISITKNN